MNKIKNDSEYEDAFKERASLRMKLKTLDRQILDYENEKHRPIFTDILDVRNFICCDGEMGAIFEFEGVLYEVGDYEELIREYGWESVVDGFNSASIQELEDSYGVIKKVYEINT